MSTWTGAVSTDWNNAANWAAGGIGTGVPSATVDAIFSGTPTRPCVLGANRTCRALTFTAYTSTVDFATFTLTANNNITFQVNQSSIIIGTTGILISGATGTVTSNGGTWPLNYTINNFIGTVTLADNMIVSGSYSASGGSRTINGSSLFVGTNLTSSASHSGTTDFIMNGSGTYTGIGACNLEIDTSGTIIVTGAVTFTRRFIITAAGSITMTAANVTILNATTVDLGGRTIGNLTHSFTIGFSTITYLTDVYCSNFSIGNGTNIYNGPGQIYASGNYVFGGASSGSLIVNLIGTGTIGVGTMGLTCIVNSSGIYTLGATLTLGTGITFTCTTSTLNAATSIVTINNGVTLSTLGINWYNITISASATITINQLLSITNNLTLNGAATFTGTVGWTCNNLIAQAAAATITLQSGVTYTTTTSVNMLGTNAQRITMRSNAPTVSYAIWTLQNPSTQSMVYVNGQGIDSSAGSTIWSFGGTITTSLVPLNWGLGSPQITKAFTFVC